MESFRKRHGPWVAAVLVAALLAAAAGVLWRGMDTRPGPASPEETTVLCETQDAQLGAWAWLGTYLGQYQQEGLPPEQRLEDWGVSHIRVSGAAASPVASLTFWVQPEDPLSEGFLYWGVYEDGEIHCEWTVQFLVTREAGGYRFSYGGLHDEGPAEPPAPAGAFA